ncbi:hypothetical protein ACWC8S_30120, partial [Streptomyces fungicidicus]
MSEPPTTDQDVTRPLTTPVPPADGLRRVASAVLGDLRAVDGALYAAVAATPTPTLDRALRRLSHTADHSKISFAIAGALALCGARPRRAALAGVGAVAVASVHITGRDLHRLPARAGQFFLWRFLTRDRWWQA